jgi:menaquinone reductase, multiheme cytochrome c subunit
MSCKVRLRGMTRRAVIFAEEEKLLFPRWANYLVPAVIVLVLGAGVLVPAVLVLGFHPDTTDVGYQPQQPVPFSHAQHAGTLKMDCRYCHSTVDRAAFAAIPPTQTCMNCHASIKADSPLLQPVRESYTTGTAISWIRVHNLPDYVYFNHAAHLAKGVGCVSCHGPIDQMPVVRQAQSLSMAWCLDCHRAPEKYLRPRDQVTNMKWDPVAVTGKTQAQLGLELKLLYQVEGMDSLTSCSTCHR